MAYTVKKLSELSGVTIRTLHFYEEIGLLKPAYHGSNGYRYYEEKELMQLQQILFFKELGFSLKQIQKVLGRDDFNQLSALYSHRKSLNQQWEKIGQLLKTIDKTIKHLKGKKKMKDKEIFDGFNITLVKKAKEGTSYFAAEEIVGKSVKNPTKNVQDVEKKGKAFYEKTTDGIPFFSSKRKVWPELESNQRHKDFQSSQVIAIPCLWLPQINQDSSSLQENFNFFKDLSVIKGERWEPSAIDNYGYITA